MEFLWLILLILPSLIACWTPDLPPRIPPDLFNATETDLFERRWEPNYPPPADDELWARALCKGRSFYDAFIMTDQEAGAQYNPPRPYAWSGWNFGHLGEWFWNVYDLPAHARHFGPPWYGIKRALRELHVSDSAIEDGGDIKVVEVYHGNVFGVPSDNGPIRVDRQTYVAGDGYTRRATGASYVFGMDHKHGTVITMNVRSPKHAAGERQPRVPENQLPHLSASSDVIWALWERYSTPENLRGLQWWFSISISNEDTRRIIRRALQAKGKDLVPYPGEYLTMGDVEALAILGSPNGVGLGYFLTQHKPRLGNMFAGGVIVFHGDTQHKAPCIAFAVRGIPA